MKICFPARKKDGKNYASVEEMMGAIGREPHGSWLAGTNLLWHGGIHISPVSAPGSVLGANQAESVVPLSCMADGEIVAWRVNNAYLTSDYNGNIVRYSSTFLLVKSVCKPDPEQEKSWLEFYSLYMGLAPLCAFSMYPRYRVTEQGDGVRLRHFSGRETSGQPVPGVSGGTLKKGTEVLILRRDNFLLQGKHEPFGLAQPLREGKPQGGKYWVSLRDGYLAQEGEEYAGLPDWMRQAVAEGKFDEVVKPGQPLKIAAGDAVGFLAEDIAPAGKSRVDSSYFAHIEVISIDARLPDFLNNPAKVTFGQQYIRIPAGKPLYQRLEEGKDSTFKSMSCCVRKDGGVLLPLESCHPLTDKDGKTWFEVRPHSWMHQDDVRQLHQYDLTGRGFTALEEEPSPDVSQTLGEKWVRGAFDEYSRQVGQNPGIQQTEVSAFYKNLAKALDTGAGNQLSEEKLYDALHHPELGIRDIAARLVVKHDSEWFGDGSHHKWKAFFQNYDRLCIDYAQKWLADMEWMSQVPAFSEGKPIWHMHPVVFLGALNQKRVLITLAMLRKIWVDSRYASNDTLQQVANELNANFYLCHLDTEYRLYHFMAQVRQETGANFSISENLNYAEPTLLNLFYYYRCHPKEAGVDGRTSTHAANQENIANKAYGGRNGNDRSGDGWLFRGQGLKQLTGRGNYREFTVYSKRTWRDSENYEINPRLISSNITLAVRTALYFWDSHNLYIEADKGYGREVSYAITKVVNKGTDSYEARFNHLNGFLSDGVFDGIF